MANYIVEAGPNGCWGAVFFVQDENGAESYEPIRGFKDKRSAEIFARELNGINGGKYTLIMRCDNEGRFSWDVAAYCGGGFVVHSKCKTYEEAVARIITLNNGQSKLLMALHHRWYRLKNWVVRSYYAVGEFLFGEDFYSWCRCGICGKFMTSKDEGVEDPETGKWCCAKHWAQEEQSHGNITS